LAVQYNLTFLQTKTMKRKLLFSLAVLIGFSASAQTNSKKQEYSRPKNSQRLEAVSIKPVPFKTGPAKTVTKTNSVIAAIDGIIDLGQAGNPFTCAYGSKQNLWADPNINAVTFIHRATTTPGSGFLVYDYSKDGGATFANNLGPVYSPATGLGSNARYPLGGIYNPVGNTVADSAYITYFAPTLNGLNGDWGGRAHGSYKLSGTFPATQKEDSSKDAYNYVIAQGFDISQLGYVYHLDASQRYDGTADYIYHDSLVLTAGMFNPVKNDFDYSSNLLYAHIDKQPDSTSSLLDYDIAFAPNGTTGYIVLLGHDDFTFQPNNTAYPIVYKTTNSGISWTGPTRVDINPLVSPFLNQGGSYTTNFDVDIIVDKNSNLHIFTGAGAETTTPYSFPSTYGTWALFDFYTEDQGATFKAEMVAMPEIMRGTFGDAAGDYISEDSRPQTSATYDGGKIFFTWFDTDTMLFGTDNLYPDMHSRGYDVISKKWTAEKNFTRGTAADGVVAFANVSKYTLAPGAGTYEIPVAFMTLDITDVLQPVQLKYIKGAKFTDAEFVGINELKNQIFSVAQNMPNPFSTQTLISVNLKKSSNLSITVLNVLGQKVMETNSFNLSPGNHNFTFERGKLNSGIYFYTVRAGNYSVTNKMIIE
jgi:hypothetical protein